jgi:hypothetical protein
MKGGRIALLVLLLAVLGGCAVINRATGITQARELQRTGLPAEATILEISDTGMTLNEDPVVDFMLEVRPEGKEAYRARTRMPISRIRIPQFQPGAVVPVNYDPKDPSRVSFQLAGQ